MADTGAVTTAPTAGAASGPGTAAAPRRGRGREGAADMIRSLGVVMLLVVSLWFFGQASPGDGKAVRAVDPTEQLADFRHVTPGVPAPTAVPHGWTPNSASYDGEVLRVGYVVGRHAFLEFAAGRGAVFLDGQTAQGVAAGTVDVLGTPWQRLRASGGQESLVRVVRGVTLVVGGTREKASLAQLEQLAGQVR